VSLSKLEIDTIAAFKRAYPKASDADASRTALELVAASHVYKDLNGVIRHDSEASRRAPAVFAPVGNSDSDEDRCARAMSKEALVSGLMPAPQSLPTTDPRLERAMAKETRLTALFGGDS